MHRFGCNPCFKLKNFSIFSHFLLFKIQKKLTLEKFSYVPLSIFPFFIICLFARFFRARGLPRALLARLFFCMRQYIFRPCGHKKTRNISLFPGEIFLVSAFKKVYYFLIGFSLSEPLESLSKPSR